MISTRPKQDAKQKATHKKTFSDKYTYFLHYLLWPCNRCHHNKHKTQTTQAHQVRYKTIQNILWNDTYNDTYYLLATTYCSLVSQLKSTLMFWLTVTGQNIHHKTKCNRMLQCGMTLGLRKTMRNLSKYSQLLDWCFKLGAPKYKTQLQDELTLYKTIHYVNLARSLEIQQTYMGL